jgi:hypothetical protein
VKCVGVANEWHEQEAGSFRFILELEVPDDAKMGDQGDFNPAEEKTLGAVKRLDGGKFEAQLLHKNGESWHSVGVYDKFEEARDRIVMMHGWPALQLSDEVKNGQTEGPIPPPAQRN